MALVQNVDQVVPCELFAAEKCAWAQLVSANETCKVFVVSVNQDPSDVQLVSETISAAWAVCLPKTMVSLLEPAEARCENCGEWNCDDYHQFWECEAFNNCELVDVKATQKFKECQN